jgi:hypothetical protein
VKNALFLFFSPCRKRVTEIFPPCHAKSQTSGAGGEGRKLLPTAQREIAYPNCCYYSKARRNN